MRCKATSRSHCLLSLRSASLGNSGNKLKDFAAKKGLIIGGQQTCHEDSGGPLWVEEGGKVNSVMSQQILNL